MHQLLKPTEYAVAYQQRRIPVPKYVARPQKGIFSDPIAIVSFVAMQGFTVVV